MKLAVSLSWVRGKETASRIISSKQAVVPGFQQTEIPARIICRCPSRIRGRPCIVDIVEVVGLRCVRVLNAGHPIAVPQLGSTQRRALHASYRASIRLHRLVIVAVVLLIPAEIWKRHQDPRRGLWLFIRVLLSPKRRRAETVRHDCKNSAAELFPDFHSLPHGTTTTSPGCSSMFCSGFFPLIASL